jgi:hypothetical protein
MALSGEHIGIKADEMSIELSCYFPKPAEKGRHVSNQARGSPDFTSPGLISHGIT